MKSIAIVNVLGLTAFGSLIYWMDSGGFVKSVVPGSGTMAKLSLAGPVTLSGPVGTSPGSAASSAEGPEKPSLVLPRTKEDFDKIIVEYKKNTKLPADLEDYFNDFKSPVQVTPEQLKMFTNFYALVVLPYVERMISTAKPGSLEAIDYIMEYYSFLNKFPNDVNEFALKFHIALLNIVFENIIDSNLEADNTKLEKFKNMLTSLNKVVYTMS